MSKYLPDLMKFINNECAILANNIGTDDIVSQCNMLVFLSYHYHVLRTVVVDDKKDTRMVTNYLLFIVGLRTPLDEPGEMTTARPTSSA